MSKCIVDGCLEEATRVKVNSGDDFLYCDAHAEEAEELGIL
mgnify:CR=1 FL=1